MSDDWAKEYPGPRTLPWVKEVHSEHPAELRCPECNASWKLFAPKRIGFALNYLKCAVCNGAFHESYSS